MKFNFIVTSWKYWEDPLRAQPLTQMYLATILENEGHIVEFIDFRDGPKTLPKADANFYTVASPDIEEVKQIIKDNPGIHIAGGPHVNIFPEESQQIFNIIVIGRGEELIKQIANDLERGNYKPVYRNSFNYSNKEYPFPRRHFLPKEKIVTSLFKTKDIPSTTVLFSHGCPFNCSFCANYNRGSITRRSLDSIKAEIRYLKEKYHIKGLSLQDEICIPLNKKEAREFLEMMSEQNILWRGQIRAGVPEDIIALASGTGCVELSIGLESVDQKVLDYSNKQMKVKQVKETLLLCNKYGIKTRVYLLNGLPGEPKDIVEKTKKFIMKVKPDVVLLSTLQPYPGSDIYNHPEKYGIKYIDKDFSKYNHLRCRFSNSKDKLEEAVPFEYEKITPFGKSFTREQIINNLKELQQFLRKEGLNK